MTDPFADDDAEPSPRLAVPAFLKDPSRPVPHVVWLALTVLVSLSLLLALRLLAVRVTPPPIATVTTATSGFPPPRPHAEAKIATAPRDADFAAFVESWRDAWERRDLDAYLKHYAKTFGSEDRDLEAWAAYKRAVFESPESIDVAIEGLEVRKGKDIMVVSFVQTYRSGSYRDRGTKRLYLLAEAGEWRIFNEEWKAQP